MSLFDGNASEMPEHRPVDDGAIEAALVGPTHGAELDALSSFVSAVRSAAEVVPTPSTAMAAVLAAGLSIDNGDLSATAASNVHGPAAQAAGLPKWRKAYMKIQGYLAGLGVVGKLALGVGVAAAATTGAGAAGVLPFSVPGVSHPRHHHSVVVPASTTTTDAPAANLPAAAPPAHHARRGGGATVHPAVETPTTTAQEPPTTEAPAPATTMVTPVTEVPPATDAPPAPATTTTVADAPSSTTTPTTEPPSGAPVVLSCTRTEPTQVTCTWNATSGVTGYQLWRWVTSGDPSTYGQIYATADGTGFVDNGVTAGTPYTYRVFTSTTGGQGPVSNKSYVS